jgi:hypothetical protein
VNKHMRMHYAHNHGDAIFVIPPYPFAGEGISNYDSRKLQFFPD